MRVIVLGCGVSGLSTGVRLLQAGYDVSIWARELPPHTTSDIAAAIWYPYKAYPEDRVRGWATRTYDVLLELAGIPGTGVLLVNGMELLPEPVEDPWWLNCVRNSRRATRHEVFAGYANGYVFAAPVVEMPIYLDRYLMGRFHGLGGEVVQRDLTTLAEALTQGPVVVNCTGLGARTLAGDRSVFPIRGQVVRIAPPPTNRFLLDEYNPDGLTYIIPRSADCILGGTAEDNNWSLVPDPLTAELIWERCARLVPEIRQAQVLEHLVGLRPGRHEVRVEAERMDDGKVVVHNYGHGGAGVTLSWGCAEEVVRMVGTARSGL